jgi:Xaa-Pro aminopeptidase
MNNQFHRQNRQKLFSLMEDNSVAIIHSGYTVSRSADSEYPFVVNRNSFYLTGINQDDVTLVMAKINNTNYEHLFIAKNDQVLVKWVGYKLFPEEASALSGIDERSISFLEGFDAYVFSLLQANRKSLGQVNAVYLDLDQKNKQHFNSFGLEYARGIQHRFPGLSIRNVYPLILRLRMIKEDPEVNLIKESIETTKEAIYSAMHHVKKAKNEAEVSAQFNYVLNCHDKRPSFEGICGSGKNGTTLHYEKNNTDIEKDSLLLMDVGTATGNYASDITRTYPVSGKFSPRQRAVYEEVLKCNKECIKFLKNGLSWQDYNNFANNLLAESCIRLGLITDKKDLNRYYYHSIGHSLGLDVHDPDLASLGLMTGMVVTVEPGIYIEEEHIGIRIEDDVLITDGGCINLSQEIIKEADDIEKLMAK